MTTDTVLLERRVAELERRLREVEKKIAVFDALEKQRWQGAYAAAQYDPARPLPGTVAETS